jgi:hypothetical protein
MNTIHDDFPHPIPAYAYLRYKENYFFVIMCPEHDVFGGLHFNNEPGFDRTKIHLDLLVKGKRVTYYNVVPISSKFGTEPFLSDGVATMTVHESHKLFSIVMKTDDLDLDLKFAARFPTYDFAASRFAAPDMVTGPDFFGLGLNTPRDVLEQPMTVSGSVRSGTDTALSFEGPAWRDHSWGFRADSIAGWHTWSVFNFPDRSYAITSQRNRSRPDLMAREGFVTDDAGARAMRMLTATPVDFTGEEGLPARMVYELTDAMGESYSLEADVAGRLGQLGLKPEVATGNQTPYVVTDNYCTIKDLKNGDIGVGLVQLGLHPEWDGDRFV